MTRVSLYRRQSRQWISSFLIINLFFLVMLALTNPYRLLPFKITIVRFNDIKPELYDRQREIKIFDIAYIRPKTILLGSSRVLWGLDPQNPLLQQYQPVYNAGVLGPSIRELDNYFKHALANQPDLKRVVLALDFYSFNDKYDGRDANEDIFGEKLGQILTKRSAMVFNFHAVANTIISSLFRRDLKSLRVDGRLIPDPTSDAELYKDFFEPFRLSTLSKHSVKDYVKKRHTGMKSTLYLPYGLSEEAMNALSHIITTCKQKNIDLVIYLPTVYHNTEVESFHEMNIWWQYKIYLHQLAKLHAFWDFTGWNKISMNRQNYIDGSHHTFSIGNIELDKMFKGEASVAPKYFGVLVNEKSVDSHLKMIDNEYYRRIRA